MNYQPHQRKVICPGDSLGQYRQLARRVPGESLWQSDGKVRETASCGTRESLVEIRDGWGPRRWRSNARFQQTYEHGDVVGEAP